MNATRMPVDLRERLLAHSRGEINWDVRQRGYWEKVPEALRRALCELAGVAYSERVEDFPERNRAALYATVLKLEHWRKVAGGALANTFKVEG